MPDSDLRELPSVKSILGCKFSSMTRTGACIEEPSGVLTKLEDASLSASASADVAQLQSQLNYSFSKVDAIVAYKKLQQAAGQLQ